MLTFSEKDNGYDLTFTAPPSVSLAVSFGGVNAEKIIDAQREAVAEVVNYIRKEFESDFPFEAIVHRENKEGDPCLHSHVLTVAPVAPCVSPRQREFGRAYRRRLADLLRDKDFAVEMIDDKEATFELIPF